MQKGRLTEQQSSKHPSQMKSPQEQNKTKMHLHLDNLYRNQEQPLETHSQEDHSQRSEDNQHYPDSSEHLDDQGGSPTNDSNDQRPSGLKIKPETVARNLPENDRKKPQGNFGETNYEL